MTEQEKLHHAKHYIDSLANGLNPLDGTPIPEQDIVNNVKISRCLFFVSDVLRKQLDGHEPKKVSEKDKKLFYITEEEKLQYVPSKTPIALHSGVRGASVGCGHCRFQRSSPALTGQKIPLLSAAAQGRCAFAG